MTQSKHAAVQSIFSSASAQYDLMNDCMSLGLHYQWKALAVDYTQLKMDDHVLDLAAGTCDITYYLHKKYGENIRITAADPNPEMLQKGRDAMLDLGIYKRLTYCHCYAEQLPFAKNSFSGVVTAFGFRNFADKPKALAEIYRVLKPGGQLLILEFSHPTSSLVQAAYHLHSQHIIPAMCHTLNANPEDYEYLIDSISKHPNPNAVLQLLADASFALCNVRTVLSGIVAIHTAYKLP